MLKADFKGIHNFASQIKGNKLPFSQKEALRLRGLQLLMDGTKCRVVACALGVNEATVIRWKKRFISTDKDGTQSCDWEAAKKMRPGPKRGSRSFLSSEQEHVFANTIENHTPCEIGYEQEVWTQLLMIDFIEKNFGVTYSQRGVSGLCSRLNLSYQVPKKRDYRADEEQLNSWKSKKFPKIVEHAKRCGAEIIFIDESTVKSESCKTRTWGKKGKTPVIKGEVRGEKINMLCALSYSGRLNYKTTYGRINSEEFIDFLEKIKEAYKGSGRLFLILDNAKIHNSKATKAYLAKNKKKIRVFFTQICTRAESF